MEMDTARITARALLDAEAFLLRPDEPFTLSSGLLAPFYVNCRKLIFHPQARAQIAEAFAEGIRQSPGLEGFDVIAGGVTAGVPFATLAADRLGVPMVYIRPQPKAHGTGSQVEGGSIAGQRVLLIEDLITTAKNVMAFTDVIRREGASIEHAWLVFSRATQTGTAQVAQAGVELHVLSTLDALLELALASGRATQADLDQVHAFIADPEGWSRSRRG